MHIVRPLSVLLSLVRSAPAAALAAESEATATGVETVAVFSRIVTLVALVLVVLALVPVVYLVYRRFFRTLGETGSPDQTDPGEQAARLEAGGDYLAAAELRLEAGDKARAAGLFEKGKDLARAAELRESLGEWDRAVELHLHSGGSFRAAAIHIQRGNYLEAAKIFRNKGDHLRAAQALEKNGNRVAAAREYREAAQYGRSARLYREEGLPAEAAETFRLSLASAEPEASALDIWYQYASYLLLAGERDRALDILRRIIRIDPSHARTRDRLRALEARPKPPPSPVRPPADEPAAEAPVEVAAPAGSAEMASSLEREMDETETAAGDGGDAFERAITLRHMIAHTRLEPRYSMRLWVQMLKALGEKHREGFFFGCLAPEQVLVDMENNIRLAPAWTREEAYTSPEVRQGGVPDAASDVWAMGVLLHEMAAGSLESFGTRRLAEVRDDVPPWMDELVTRCVEEDRGKRYATVEDISAALRKLMQARGRGVAADA